MNWKDYCFSMALREDSTEELNDIKFAFLQTSEIILAPSILFSKKFNRKN